MAAVSVLGYPASTPNGNFSDFRPGSLSALLNSPQRTEYPPQHSLVQLRKDLSRPPTEEPSTPTPPPRKRKNHLSFAIKSSSIISFTSTTTSESCSLLE